MANGSKDGIRVVKKVRKGHGSHHGGAWKVAYADFVTAMMAFFLVMWIVGLNTAVKEAIASYFNDPIGFMEGVERGDKPLNLTTPGVLACPDVKPEMRKDSYDLKKRADEERKRLENAKEALEEVVAKCPDLKRVADSIRINIVSQGLRIDLVETRSDLFFDSGSATPRPRTRHLLCEVARELGRLPNGVVIEGHTDSRPYCGPNGWTNWELSTARANAARAIMTANGLRNKQVIEVRGLADTMPLDPKRTDSFKNRRVSILIPYKETNKPVNNQATNNTTGH